jgi:hypothetical protein
VNSELQVYEQQTRWLLGQFALNLRQCPPAIWTARPPAALEGNNLLAIAKHATAVTRAYALGIGCGLDVYRNRADEFSASEDAAAAILAELDTLPAELAGALQALDPTAPDALVLPSQALYGTGQPREMSAREAIVENIRHLGIHLGELRLTRSLLEGAARAD